MTADLGSNRAVGMVGIGAIGEPVARRLAEVGFDLLAYDADPARRAAVSSVDNITVVASAAELRRAEIVICLLPTSSAVREVLAGGDPLFGLLAPGALIVDMGSSDPAETAKLARDAATAGVGLVDAPVSGGVAKARTGQLTVMFGGTDAELERCRGVLEAVGESVIHVGPVSSGHALKALNNLLSAVGLAAASEVMETGRRYGLDPETMLDVINQSTGRNHATETKVAQFVLSGTYASGFALRLMVKDVTTAIGLAKSMKVATPIGEACLKLWQEAARRLPPDADQTRIAMMPGGLGQAAGAEKSR